MTRRVTTKQLDAALRLLTNTLGLPKEPFASKIGEHPVRWNVGALMLDGNAGGWRVEQIVSDGGATKNITDRGTPKETFDAIHNLIRGAELAGKPMKGNPRGRSRAFAAIYGRKQRFPKYTSQVSPLSAQSGDAGKMLRQRLPNMTKAQHIAEAQRFVAESARLQWEWEKTRDQEHKRVFGKAPEFHDYKISGIGRDEYSAPVKNKLRGLAHKSSAYLDASLAHWRAAGKTMDTWRRMRAQLPRQDEFVPEWTRAKKNPQPRKTSIQLIGAKTGKLYAALNSSVSTLRELRQTAQRLADRFKEAIRVKRVTGMKENPRSRFGEQTSCAKCGQDIEFHGGKTWLDRGGNTSCVTYFDRAKGEYVKPQGKHAPIKAKQNPIAESSAHVRAAARRFKRFTGHEAELVKNVSLPRHSAGLAIGPVLSVAYETTRDGKRERYVHAFRPASRPLLAASSDGSTLYLLGGAYRFTDRGIVDR